MADIKKVPILIGVAIFSFESIGLSNIIYYEISIWNKKCNAKIRKIYLFIYKSKLLC